MGRAVAKMRKCDLRRETPAQKVPLFECLRAVSARQVPLCQ